MTKTYLPSYFVLKTLFLILMIGGKLGLGLEILIIGIIDFLKSRLQKP
jgi:hypothetical protein